MSRSSKMFQPRFVFLSVPTTSSLRVLLYQQQQPKKKFFFLKSTLISKSSGTHGNIHKTHSGFFIRKRLSFFPSLVGIMWCFSLQKLKSEFCFSLPPPLSHSHVQFIEVLIVCLSQGPGLGIQASSTCGLLMSSIMC